MFQRFSKSSAMFGFLFCFCPFVSERKRSLENEKKNVKERQNTPKKIIITDLNLRRVKKKMRLLL